ncbi:uncharacterized protein LOC18008534 [Eutrema salsugineum]|uniref:uncharacterized protein LOC18008534 n=1 Tax=Eutrema salsugineum TaxID=72664 RepID=UPI000CED7B1B|nr:uncharacterized protein LOC18008534 [Eutrema salsugineum]
MVADSITDSELSHGSPISRDFAMKRKANWFWKLKQWKIDARRRQWIYQWKRANAGEEENGSRLRSLRDKLTDRKKASDRIITGKAWSIDHGERSYEFTKCDHDNNDDDLSSSSPTSVLKNKDSHSSKSGDDCFCCSNQIIEGEEEAFDDAYENWDDFSDALNFFDENEDNRVPLREPEDQKADQNPNTSQRNESSSPEKLSHKDKRSEKSSSLGNKSRGKKNKSGQQKECGDEISECPICSEDMDATDLSFLPCPCGFRLCLFCHNKINEDVGRCPACRNQYDHQTSSSSSSGEVSFLQRGRGTVRLSPSFKGLDRA